MPLITIWNWNEEWFNFPQDGVYRKMNLAKILRQAVVEAGIPGIDGVELVSVCFAGPQVLSDDRTLAIIVELLNDLPERTDNIRQRLAEKLWKAAMDHLEGTACREWNVEVAVKRFDPVKDGFCS